MPYEFKLPDLGEGLTEGEVARWLVAEGDEIAEDAPLVEIQTDKTTVEIPSPAAGTVRRILVAEGEVVPVGTVLVVIGDDEAAAAATSSANVSASDAAGGQTPAVAASDAALGQTPDVAASDAALGQTPDVAASDAALGQTPDVAGRGTAGGRLQATPLVRRLAQELGVALESVAATGSGGRITEDDVRAAARPSEGRREKVRGVRRQIVEHLTLAHREVPAVTFVEECDFSNIDLQQLLPAVLRATALSLQEFPELNARLEGDEIVYLDHYDLGIAVQTDQGLVVPVVRDCARRTLDELRADVDSLAERARAGKLDAADLRGSTFTITSAGKLAGLFVTPLVNFPEVGILGIHRIGPRPVVRDGEVVVRPVGNVSVTFDHRVVDGARAAQFTLAVIARLEG